MHSLVRALQSDNAAAQIGAVSTLHRLAMSDLSRTAVALAEACGAAPMVRLLGSGTPIMAMPAVYLLWNMAEESDAAKHEIVAAGGAPALVRMCRSRDVTSE